MCVIRAGPTCFTGTVPNNEHASGRFSPSSSFTSSASFEPPPSFPLPSFAPPPSSRWYRCRVVETTPTVQYAKGKGKQRNSGASQVGRDAVATMPKQRARAVNNSRRLRCAVRIEPQDDFLTTDVSYYQACENTLPSGEGYYRQSASCDTEHHLDAKHRQHVDQEQEARVAARFLLVVVHILQQRLAG